MEIKKYKPISYLQALLYRVEHKKCIDKIISVIRESQTRFSMNKDLEGHDDSSRWCFGVCDEKYTQIQCVNCYICGEYIESSFYLPKIYCRSLDHHDLVEIKNRIFYIKKNLNYFDITKHKSYLYRASLDAIILKDLRLIIFYKDFLAYIGIYF